MTETPSFGLQYRYGSHKGPMPPAFCRGCGKPMAISVEPDRYEPFDATTGQPRTERHARCPKPWWARLNPTIAHDHAVQDEHGDWAWL